MTETDSECMRGDFFSDRGTSVLVSKYTDMYTVPYMLKRTWGWFFSPIRLPEHSLIIRQLYCLFEVAVLARVRKNFPLGNMQFQAPEV